MRAFLSRMIRAVKILARHDGIPKPLRWLAAIGLLPVPGPFDEAVLVLVAAILYVFYRPQLRAVWDAARRPASSR
jgi:hypothetical protein